MPLLVAAAAGLLAVAGAVVGAGVLLVPKPASVKSSSATPTSTTATSTKSGGTSSGFADLRARGTLRVAADPDAPPFLSRSGAGWEGYEYAVISAIASQAHVDVEVVEAPFDQLLDTVRGGKADLALGQLAPTPADGILWSLSYLQYDVCLVVSATSATRTLNQLSGQTIGLYDDPTTRAIIDGVHGSRWTPRLFNTFGYFDLLARGEFAGFVYDCPLARHELRGRSDVRIVDDTLGVGTYAVAFPSGSAGLLEEVNEVLVELGSTGLLRSLASRWLASPERPGDYPSAAGKVVVVRPGETLDAVAARALGSAARAADLRSRNSDILGTNGTTVYAGMRLRVP